LSERLSAEPNDKEGWRILALSYVGRQKYADAAEAYRRLTELEPDNPDHLSAYGETLVMAANGHVNNEAQAVFDSVMKLDPNDPRARFFRGMTLDQAGETRAALDIWIDIVNTAPPGSGWVVDIRRQIEERAQEAGIDISGQLKKAAPAPSQQQIDDAMAMPEQDREAMIQNMVDGLADRLAENPNDPDGWIRLINARVVLGQDEQAKQALIGALEVFNNKPEIRNRIVEAAKSRNISIE
jgi:cytochrome c-type biogenesis protein CcmH